MTWVDALRQLWEPGIWVFVCALVVSLLATPLFRWVAYRMGIYDRPDDAVKIHRRPVPYLGGCAVWLAWTSGLVMNHLLFHPSYASAGIALAAGGALAFGLGLVDDLVDLNPRVKLVGQALVAAVLLLGGIRWSCYPVASCWSFSALPVDSWVVLLSCLAVHFVVVIGATNATNLLDGMDGLCAGVTVIISLGFLLLATSLTAWARWDPTAVDYAFSPMIMLVTFALAGALLGFLPYNFNPARIFLGDAGSVFIGYVLGASMVMFAGQPGVIKWFVGALFIFGVPIFDTGLAIVRRLVNRRPIMMPDRSHLYNQLVDRLGFTVRQAVAIMYGLSIILGAAGLLVLFIPGRHAVVIYGVMAVAFLVTVWRLGFLRMTAEELAAADRYRARKLGN
jgi:UDP-GlcNAc:undecaprenyl-phosphate GlcNAc-1-phosphate transferase